MELRVQQALQVLLAQREQQEAQVPSELRVLQEPLALLDQPVLQVLE